MKIKSVFYLGGMAATYFTILACVPHPGLALALCVLAGMLSAGIGFNIGHDAIHGAYSADRRVNRLMGHSFSMIGAHVYTWRILHNVIHHTYTNVIGADGDLHPVPWLRFHAGNEGLRRYHRFQHLYAIPLYSLTSLAWVFKKDFEHIRKDRHLLYDKPVVPRAEFVELYAFKALYFAVTLLVPWLAGFAFWQVALGFVSLHLAQGLMLALTFQLGHLVEGPTVTSLSAGPTSELGSWQRHQVAGTSNFAPGSRLAAWLFGGLNCQIEHHLFPQVCHVHYPALSAIVKQTAGEFGVPYHEQPSFFAALRSHLRLLRAYGRGRAFAA